MNRQSSLKSAAANARKNGTHNGHFRSKTFVSISVPVILVVFITALCSSFWWRKHSEKRGTFQANNNDKIKNSQQLNLQIYVTSMQARERSKKTEKCFSWIHHVSPQNRVEAYPRRRTIIRPVMWMSHFLNHLPSLQQPTTLPINLTRAGLVLFTRQLMITNMQIISIMHLS